MYQKMIDDNGIVHYVETVSYHVLRQDNNVDDEECDVSLCERHVASSWRTHEEAFVVCLECLVTQMHRVPAHLRFVGVVSGRMSWKS